MHKSPDDTELPYPVPFHPHGLWDQGWLTCCAGGRPPSTNRQAPWEWEQYSAAIAGYNYERYSKCTRHQVYPCLLPASWTLHSSVLPTTSPLVFHSSLLPAEKAKYLFPTDTCYNQKPALFRYCAQGQPMVSQAQKSLWLIGCLETDWGRASFSFSLYFILKNFSF